jgi:hypothetical protein
LVEKMAHTWVERLAAELAVPLVVVWAVVRVVQSVHEWAVQRAEN